MRWWLALQPAQPTTIVRITSQPNIDPGDWRRDRTWTYGYRAVLRDGDGALVAAHDIYSRALHPDRLRAYKRLPLTLIRDAAQMEEVAIGFELLGVK